MKKYLFVMRHAPHLGSRLQETLDQMLTSAAFDQQVEVLFIDDGVLQIKQGQNPGGKDTASIFNVLSVYGITRLMAESESLRERGLNESDLQLPVETIARRQIAGLLASYAVLVPD